MDDPVKQAVRLARQTAQQPGIDVWHGTPHTFPAERLVKHPTGQREYIQGGVDQLPEVPEGAKVVQDFPLGRFRSSQIGTGEGAQAYGHGLYLAKSRPVGESYAVNQEAAYKRLSGHMSPKEEFAHDVGTRPGARDWDVMQALVQKYGSSIDFDEAKQLADVAIKNQGRLYHSRINAHPDHFLDWDKPLSEQSEHVRRAFGKAHAGDDPFLSELFSGSDVPPEYFGLFPKSKGSQSYNDFASKVGGPEKASKILLSSGIRGIRYLDQGSRGAGKGTHNYVVFDPNDIEIMKRYARGGMVYHGHAPGHPVQTKHHYASGGFTEAPEKSIRRAMMVARGLSHAVGPVPSGYATKGAVTDKDVPFQHIEKRSQGRANADSQPPST